MSYINGYEPRCRCGCSIHAHDDTMTQGVRGRCLVCGCPEYREDAHAR